LELKIRDSKGKIHDVQIDFGASVAILNGDEKIPFEIIRREKGVVGIIIGDKRLPINYSRDGIRIELLLDGTKFKLERETSYAFLTRAKDAGSSGLTEVRSPIPGVISSINVTEKKKVKEGDVLCILQAMKMENEIASTQKGKIKEILVVEGERVSSDQVLMTIEN
tara:strand:+ start:35 stop:532 length:498 start_codon:yes stop_codon:yes gene_type:complete